MIAEVKAVAGLSIFAFGVDFSSFFHFHFLLQHIKKVEDELLSIMLFVRIELGLKASRKLFDRGRTCFVFC